MKKNTRIAVIVIVAIIVVIIVGLFGVLGWYKNQLKPVNPSAEGTLTVDIPRGATTDEVLRILGESHLIGNKNAVKLYIKLSDFSGIQAGTYELSQASDVAEILQILHDGVATAEDIKITFIEGRTFTDFAEIIAKNTNNKKKDVLKLGSDREYLESLIDKYWFITEDILNSDIYYPLEGYLFPDTYFFAGVDCTIESIFEKMLDQMGMVLSEYRDDIEDGTLSAHEILTLASVVEAEGSTANDRSGVAGVFYNRLDNGMSLGSDVTCYYGIQVKMSERDLSEDEINTYNPYNTRGPEMFGKLPVGPICMPSRMSIEGTVYPEATSAFYFVADKNGEVYFNDNFDGHINTINRLKNEGLWYEY